MAVQVDPGKRLGSGPEGAAAIKAHAWFSHLNWEKLEARQLTAPMIPTIKDPLDTSNFDDFDDVDAEPASAGLDRNAAHWEGLWDWINQAPKKAPSSKRLLHTLSRRDHTAIVGNGLDDEGEDDDDDEEDEDEESSR